MDRGAWRATVCSVELKQLSMTRHLSIRRIWVSNGSVDLESLGWLCLSETWHRAMREMPLCWLSSKESTLLSRRLGFHPWVAKIPWRRKWQHTPVLPGKSHGQRSLVELHSIGSQKTQLSNWTTTTEKIILMGRGTCYHQYENHLTASI